jgi:KUP system potassium uptake protein
MTVIAPSELGNPTSAKTRGGDLALAGLAALGIVFGDIGTSPLYTLKTAFDFLGGEATPDRILGVIIIDTMCRSCSLPASMA